MTRRDETTPSRLNWSSGICLWLREEVELHLPPSTSKDGAFHFVGVVEDTSIVHASSEVLDALTACGSYGTNHFWTCEDITIPEGWKVMLKDFPNFCIADPTIPVRRNTRNLHKRIPQDGSFWFGGFHVKASEIRGRKGTMTFL